MKKRRDSLTNVLGPLDGARIAGGCDHCDAYQTVGVVEAGIWTLTVHHDESCPWWNEYAPKDLP